MIKTWLMLSLTKQIVNKNFQLEQKEEKREGYENSYMLIDFVENLFTLFTSRMSVLFLV